MLRAHAACLEKTARGRFFPRVALLASDHSHVRFVPGSLAETLVNIEAAVPKNSSGRIREIVLARPVRFFAVRIGDPEGRWGAIRFYRWRHLDNSATRVVEHHPRCLW